jgi:hypothetical protein
MTQWPHDNQEARNAFYGDPGRNQIAAQMVPVTPPFAMYYDGKRVKSIMFHRKAAGALLAALNEIWDYCQHDQKKIDAAGVSKYAGAYNHRLVRGSTTKWSNHAYAAAIDLNAGENALGAKGNMPQFVTDAFCRQGAMWGGWYTHRPDWMHYEFVDNGGRQPKSSKPVWPAVAHHLVDLETDAPADELEDAPPAPRIPPQPASPPAAPVAIDPEVVGDPDLFSAQKRLKGRHYSPGIIDGKWGGGTAGAISAFRNDSGLTFAMPASLEEFHGIKDELAAELQRWEDGARFRPVTADRAKGDAATVAAVAPEVVPVKQNRLLTIWGAVCTFFAGIYKTFSDTISNAWDWIWDLFTDHKDDLPTDPGFLQTAWGYVTAVPSEVWIFAAALGFVFLAVKAHGTVKKITESVQTGARQ